MDMRTLQAGDAANAMLKWSYNGSILGGAYGGQAAINGSIGVGNTLLDPQATTWWTIGVSGGFGTPGGAFNLGGSYSFPSFGGDHF